MVLRRRPGDKTGFGKFYKSWFTSILRLNDALVGAASAAIEVMNRG
jgi:hypothetical protein